MVWTSILPSFLASIVESVEALTIVLAIGLTINWKSSLLGAGAAILSINALIAIISSILLFVPIEILRLVVGILLIIFGLQWLKKSVLRYSGLKRKHDESVIYNKEIIDINTQKISKSKNFNNFGFATSYKSVLFKGLDVAFIIITLGVTAANNRINGIYGASICAIITFLVIIILGSIIHKPLAKVPENTLKYLVGIILVSYGTYEAGKGLGIQWINYKLSVLTLISFFSILSFITIYWLKTYNAKDTDVKQCLEDR
jgi:Ca2+/H+ antiporter, TMEM165/GDT1 family